MSKKSKLGCCGPIIGLWLIALAFSLLVYGLADNSKETVEETDFDELLYFAYARTNVAAEYNKEQHKKRLVVAEASGIDVDEELIDVLDDIEFVRDIELSSRPQPGTDMELVTLSFKVLIEMFHWERSCK